MSGLGTGAAPFRAFLQHLALLSSQGQEIGPVYYYFGSRHQASEYLYGEEIEAFILDGTITRAGLAFSRDGAKKVYIQHKMLEDSEALSQMLHDQEGVFYLCGPTWPVPDVYEALVNALVKYRGFTLEQAGTYLESLKEQERYVLEVSTILSLHEHGSLMYHPGLLVVNYLHYIHGLLLHKSINCEMNIGDVQVCKMFLKCWI
jgi:sulfite reductase (NADPH) flavoprotein alpha-component